MAKYYQTGVPRRSHLQEMLLGEETVTWLAARLAQAAQTADGGALNNISETTWESCLLGALEAHLGGRALPPVTEDDRQALVTTLTGVLQGPFPHATEQDVHRVQTFLEQTEAYGVLADVARRIGNIPGQAFSARHSLTTQNYDTVQRDPAFTMPRYDAKDGHMNLAAQFKRELMRRPGQPREGVAEYEANHIQRAREAVIRTHGGPKAADFDYFQMRLWNMAAYGYTFTNDTVMQALGGEFTRHPHRDTFDVRTYAAGTLATDVPRSAQNVSTFAIPDDTYAMLRTLGALQFSDPAWHGHMSTLDRIEASLGAQIVGQNHDAGAHNLFFFLSSYSEGPVSHTSSIRDFLNTLDTAVDGPKYNMIVNLPGSGVRGLEFISLMLEAKTRGEAYARSPAMLNAKIHNAETFLTAVEHLPEQMATQGLDTRDATHHQAVLAEVYLRYVFRELPAGEPRLKHALDERLQAFVPPVTLPLTDILQCMLESEIAPPPGVTLQQSLLDPRYPDSFDPRDTRHHLARSLQNLFGPHVTPMGTESITLTGYDALRAKVLLESHGVFEVIHSVDHIKWGQPKGGVQEYKHYAEAIGEYWDAMKWLCTEPAFAERPLRFAQSLFKPAQARPLEEQKLRGALAANATFQDNLHALESALAQQNARYVPHRDR